MRITKIHKLTVLVLGLACLGLFQLSPHKALAASPTTINFQGKVVNSNGTNVADSSYTFVFRLYNTSTPTIGTTCTSGSGCLWQETDTLSTTSGVFQVELGNAGGCSFFNAAACNNSTPIDFTSNSLYLTMNFNGDTTGTCNSNPSNGYMCPLIHFTGIPYAYQASNSASLGGLASGNFVQLAQGVQSVTSNTNPLVFLKQSGSANLLELQGSSSDVFVVGNTGATTITNTGTSAFTVQGAASVLKVDTTDSLVNAQGINSVAALGSELIDNGGSTTCSGTNWSGSGHGPYTHTAGSTVVLSCSPPSSVTNGAYYQVEFTTASVTAGNVKLGVGGSFTTSSPIYDNESNQFQVVQAGAIGAVVFGPSTDFAGAVTIQSIKLITNASAVIDINNSDATAGTEIRSGGSGLANTFIGLSAGLANSSGGNTGIGVFALNVNTTGQDNSATGTSALRSNTTGGHNSALGNQALYSNTTGSNNSSVGYLALTSNTAASGNSALGTSALANTTTGAQNSALGYNAGSSNKSGGNNTFIGAYAGYQDPNATTFVTPSNLQNAAAIGYGAQVQESNAIVLGSVGTTSSSLATNVGIGTTSPTNLFSISPDIYDTGTASVTSGTTAVSESGATWNSNFTGMEIIFADGTKYTIASATATSITLSSNASATETSSAYRIQNPAFFVSSTGTAQFRASTNSTTAFQVQGSGSLNLLAVDTQNTIVNIGVTGATATASTVNIANSFGNAAQSVVIGSLQSSSTTTIQAGSGNLNLATQAGADIIYSEGAGSSLQIAASTAPTVDMLSISNAGHAVTTANANGLHINYTGGSAAVEAAGLRIDYTPGTTSGGTWDGLRIVAGATGAASGVTAYGLKLEGPATAGGGSDEAVYVGSGWDIGLDIQSGGLQLAAQNDPATPAANELQIYAKSIAGRIMPKWLSPTGFNTPFQASLGFNRVAIVNPGGGSTCSSAMNAFATAFTNSPTCANPTPTSTNLMTSTRRTTISTGTTAGTVAYHKQSTLIVWRGNVAGEGGFFFTTRFATDTLQSGNRAFVGLADSVSAPTNVDPTTNTTPGKIGLAINSNTGNWNFVNNITGTAPTVTNLGSSFPVNTTDLYELVMFCPPNGSTITYRVTDLSTGAQTTNSVSSNIPAATTFLAPLLWITNNATAAAAIMDIGGWYLESDL